MPSASAWRIRSSWISFQAGVCTGLMAPVRRVSLSLGMTSPQSTPITRPKPRQASQAPTAELKENSEGRSEEHTSELQSQSNLVCRLLLEKKKKRQTDK